MPMSQALPGLQTDSSNSRSHHPSMNDSPSAGKWVADRLQELADQALTLDADNISAEILYTEEDAMNALMIFSHVCSNIAIHKMLANNLPVEEARTLHEQKGNDLAEVFIHLTGIDSRTYYQ